MIPLGLIAVALLGASMTFVIILLERLALPWKHSSSMKKGNK